MLTTTIGLVRLLGTSVRSATRWTVVGAFASVAAIFSSPLVAQSQAPGAVTAALNPPAATTAAATPTTEIDVVPSERATPGTVRIDPVEEEYRIGTQDLVEVQVLGVQDLRREARVNAKGMIGLPLIGTVKIAGLTSAEAEALIAGLYSKNYLQNPEVSVFVKEYTRQNVTIDGAVAKPGIYPLKGPTTMLQALANAGGPAPLSDLSDVTLFRMADGERRTLKFDVVKIRAAEAPDPLLQPGDLIVVNRSAARVAIRDSFLGDLLGILNPFSYLPRP